MQDYRKLKVWQKAHDLALAVYDATARFPREEIYGLTNQIRRAAGSVPSNIVEGCGRGSNAELMRFLYSALGAANEVEYQLLLARDLGFLQPDVHDRLSADAVELKRMLSALIVKLRSSR
jgi:four helix bundle protein